MLRYRAALVAAGHQVALAVQRIDGITVEAGGDELVIAGSRPPADPQRPATIVTFTEVPSGCTIDHLLPTFFFAPSVHSGAAGAGSV